MREARVPPRRDYPGREPRAVPVLEHVRNRDPAEHRRGRGARPGNRREAGRREHACDRKPARHPSDPRPRRVEQGMGEPRVVGDEPDEDEHREDAQDVVDRLRVRNRADDPGPRLPADEPHHPDEAREGRRREHPYPEEHRDQQPAGHDEADGELVHQSFFPALASPRPVRFGTSDSPARAGLDLVLGLLVHRLDEGDSRSVRHGAPPRAAGSRGAG